MTPRLLSALLLAAALLLALPVPSEAGGGHGVVGPGKPWGHRSRHGWPRAWWTPDAGWAPWTPAVEVPEPSLRPWYYCPEARDYFPYILDCPGGWIQVLPEQARWPKGRREPEGNHEGRR